MFSLRIFNLIFYLIAFTMPVYFIHPQQTEVHQVIVGLKSADLWQMPVNGRWQHVLPIRTFDKSQSSF